MRYIAGIDKIDVIIPISTPSYCFISAEIEIELKLAAFAFREEFEERQKSELNKFGDKYDVRVRKAI